MVEWALEYESDLRIEKSYTGLDPGWFKRALAVWSLTNATYILTRRQQVSASPCSPLMNRAYSISTKRGYRMLSVSWSAVHYCLHNSIYFDWRGSTFIHQAMKRLLTQVVSHFNLVIRSFCHKICPLRLSLDARHISDKDPSWRTNCESELQ